MQTTNNSGQWADPWSKQYSFKEYTNTKIPEALLTDYLTEDELRPIIDSAISKGASSSSVRQFLKSLCRHFSEEFILEYYDYFDYDLLREYYSDIFSGKYSALALKFNVEDK